MLIVWVKKLIAGLCIRWWSAPLGQRKNPGNFYGCADREGYHIVNGNRVACAYNALSVAPHMARIDQRMRLASRFYEAQTA